MINRFLQVTNGLFRGSAPDLNDLNRLKNIYKIKKIVSLDGRIGEKITNKVKSLGMKHVIIPLDYRSSSMLKLLEYDLRDLFQNEGPVFVHCAQGKDRTGVAIALFECKYMGEDPEQAIKRAKALGMGYGLDPKITEFYEKIIRSCKSNKDVNDADIVSNVREPTGDNKDSYLDQAQQGSFAPYISTTKQAPMDPVYNSIDDQSPTRENYQSYKNVPDIETMNFPEEEYIALKKRLDNEKPIYTTRVSSECGVWEMDQIIKSPFGLLKITDIDEINSLEEHPFLEELTDDQKNELSSYNDMEVIKLIQLYIPNQDVIIENNVMPLVGLFNNNTGGSGAAPINNAGGFFYD